MKIAMKGIIAFTTLSLTLMGMSFLVGCGDSPTPLPTRTQPVTSAVAPPTVPTDKDRAEAVLQPTTPSNGDVTFTSMSVETTMITTLETPTGGSPQIIVIIPDAASPGGKKSAPMDLFQIQAGSVGVYQKVILPPGNNRIILSPTTRVKFVNPPATSLLRAPIASGTYELNGLTIDFTVNPPKPDGTVNWTLPTSLILRMNQLESGEYQLRGSELIGYWDGITSIRPANGLFKATTKLYDANGNLKTTVWKHSRINELGYGYIRPNGMTTFNGIHVTFDLLN